jgi:hypothetical protein
VFDKLQDFFPKHSYGKIAATVQTTWIPVRTCSSIRQVSHSKSSVCVCVLQNILNTEFNSDTKPIVNASQADLISEGVFDTFLYLKADP